jgi:hypothetical protein
MGIVERLVLIDPRNATDLTKALRSEPDKDNFNWLVCDLPPNELAMDHIRFTPKLAGPGKFRGAVEWEMDDLGNIIITKFAVVDRTAAEVTESAAPIPLPR